MFLAIIQAIVICIATLFSIQDIEELQSSSFPVATLFIRATSPNVAAFLLSIIAISQFGCLCNVIVATGQLIWAMARDGCIPNHQFWYKLHGKRQIPLRIFILVAVISIILVIPVRPCHFVSILKHTNNQTHIVWVRFWLVACTGQLS